MTDYENIGYSTLIAATAVQLQAGNDAEMYFH